MWLYLKLIFIIIVLKLFMDKKYAEPSHECAADLHYGG